MNGEFTNLFTIIGLVAGIVAGLIIGYYRVYSGLKNYNTMANDGNPEFDQPGPPSKGSIAILWGLGIIVTLLGIGALIFSISNIGPEGLAALEGANSQVGAVLVIAVFLLFFGGVCLYGAITGNVKE